MTKEQCEAFMKAIEASGIKVYEFDSDLGTRFYNNPNGNSIAVPNYDLEAIVCVRSAGYGGSHKRYEANVELDMSDFGDIHETRTAGTAKEIKAFCEAINLPLDDDQFKIVLNIDKANIDLKPETGDYVSAFHYLSKAEIARLTPQEKAEYEESLKEYEEKKRNYIGQNQAASITL